MMGLGTMYRRAASLLLVFAFLFTLGFVSA